MHNINTRMHLEIANHTGCHVEFCWNLEVLFHAKITSVELPNLVKIL